MHHVTTDSDSGVELYRLVDDPRPADNIYGEQPYGAADGRSVAIRYYDTDDRDGSLALLDLETGNQSVVVEHEPRFPVFHAWGEYLYYQVKREGRIHLKRIPYAGGESEHVYALPELPCRFSYGTVSPDHRHYVVTTRDEEPRRILHVDLHTGEWRSVAERVDRLFKHEQFAQDGSNRVLIQANVLPDVDEVHLGVLDVERDRPSLAWLAADEPHTPRPTGHEAWIGDTDRVLFSTAMDETIPHNLWTVGVTDDTATPVLETDRQYGHVSVSRCGEYWIGDVPSRDGVPIDIGSIATGSRCQLVTSETVHSSEQPSHTHPYLTADNRWLIFTTTRARWPQVYGAKVPEELLGTL